MSNDVLVGVISASHPTMAGGIAIATGHAGTFSDVMQD
jgi:hypothetical protein